MHKLFILFVITLVMGCASTENQGFTIDLPQMRQLKHSVGIYPAKVSPVDFSTFRSADFRYSGFDQADVKPLQQSLLETLRQNKLFGQVKQMNAFSQLADIKVHWLLRNGSIVTQGSQAWGVACVSYCITDSLNRVRFQEEFSVSDKEIRCSVGRMKQKLSAAIVNRMMVRLSSIGRRTKERRLVLADSFNGVRYSDDFDTAAGILPQEMFTTKYAVTDYQFKNMNWKAHMGLSDDVNWRVLLSKTAMQ
ncbi:hypothetical protein KAH55_09770 [bacterium]|nr:hypothetical protein [bacterium]